MLSIWVTHDLTLFNNAVGIQYLGKVHFLQRSRRILQTIILDRGNRHRCALFRPSSRKTSKTAPPPRAMRVASIGCLAIGPSGKTECDATSGAMSRSLCFPNDRTTCHPFPSLSHRDLRWCKPATAQTKTRTASTGTSLERCPAHVHQKSRPQPTRYRILQKRSPYWHTELPPEVDIVLGDL